MDNTSQTAVELVKLLQSRIESHEALCLAERERQLQWMNALGAKMDLIVTEVQQVARSILVLEHEDQKLGSKVDALSPKQKREVKSTSATWAGMFGVLAASLYELAKTFMP